MCLIRSLAHSSGQSYVPAVLTTVLVITISYGAIWNLSHILRLLPAPRQGVGLWGLAVQSASQYVDAVNQPFLCLTPHVSVECYLWPGPGPIFSLQLQNGR